MFGLEDLRKRLGDLKIASVDIFIDALTDNTSGTLCILDDGFVKLSEGTAKYKSQFTYVVNPAVTKTDFVQPPVNVLAKKAEIKVSTPGIKASQTYESTVLISGNIESVCPIEVVAVSGEEAGWKIFALLIGVSKYKDGLMPDLFYPLKDATSIREV